MGGGGGGRGGGGGGGARGGGGGYGGGGRPSGGYSGGASPAGGYGGGAPVSRPAPRLVLPRRNPAAFTVPMAAQPPAAGKAARSRDQAAARAMSPGKAALIPGRTAARVSQVRAVDRTPRAEAPMFPADRGNVYTGPRGSTVVTGGKAGAVTGPGGNTAAGARRRRRCHRSQRQCGTPAAGKSAASRLRAARLSAALVAARRSGQAARRRMPAELRSASVPMVRSPAAAGPWRRVDAMAAPPTALVLSEHRTSLARERTFVAALATTTRSGRVGIPSIRAQWAAAGWVAGSAWSAASWGSACSTVGYAESAAPFTYDYGDNITYQDGQVYYGEQPAGTEAQYAEQASAIADAGASETGRQ